jgi:hypothetical protein
MGSGYKAVFEATTDIETKDYAAHLFWVLTV